MADLRRRGDTRPLIRDDVNPLSWKPTRPVRWLPRHGAPYCVLEWTTQHAVKILALLPVYTAIVVTLVLLMVIFGVPFVDGK